jgi:hypothetical protein
MAAAAFRSSETLEREETLHTIRTAKVLYGPFSGRLALLDPERLVVGDAPGLQFQPIGAGDEVDALLKGQIHAAQEGVRRGGIVG